MNPNDASVYSDTWSSSTWVLILGLMIVFVMTLMVAFIALVHRSIEHSADTPRTQVLNLPSRGSSSSSHAA